MEMSSLHVPSGASSIRRIPSPKASIVHKNLQQDAYGVDIEQKVLDDAHLLNNTIRNFLWSGVTVTVKDHESKRPKAILDSVSGFVQAGRLKFSVPLNVEAHLAQAKCAL